METIKAIEDRRSIRWYLEDKLDKSIIEDILNCGRLAPSAKNRQPWYFVVVRDEVKNKIVDLMNNYSEYNTEFEEEIYPKSIPTTSRAIKGASTLILIYREKNDGWLISDTLSIGACVENMCLRATDLNIGSLWIRDICYVEKEISKLLGIDMELSCAVILGKPNQEPKMRPRKELKDIVKWYN